jgi:uncharacterized protein YciI
MSYFFYKLIPPRATFPADITERETAIMQEHFAYWEHLLAERKVVAIGPVLDPKGTYGIAVLEVEDERSAQNLAKKDPAITSEAGFSFEVYPMLETKVRQ